MKLKIPRHTLNLLSLQLISLYIYLYLWDKHDTMKKALIVNYICGTLYHGTHTLGFEKIAKKIFMLPDIISVISSFMLLIYISPKNDITKKIIILTICATLFWLSTFKNIYNKNFTLQKKFNVIQSFLHICGLIAHHFAYKNYKNEYYLNISNMDYDISTNIIEILDVSKNSTYLDLSNNIVDVSKNSICLDVSNNKIDISNNISFINDISCNFT